MSSYPRLATRLYNAPLLITREKAEVIEAVFRAYCEGRDDAPKLEPPQNPRPELAATTFRETPGGYLLSDRGIAVVPIFGTLVQRGGFMDAMSGLTSYQLIGQQIDAAMGDPRVRGIMLEIDSPGGEGAGVFDLASQIRAKSKQKPIWAVANEMAFSAAYALASAAEKISVPQLAMAGSIGVIMLHVDQSAYDSKRGLVYTPIFAGARKNDFSPHEPLSAEAMNTAQRMVDKMYTVFVDTVAGHRSMDAGDVVATEAGVFHGQDAIDTGLADLGLNFADTVQMMVDDLNSPNRLVSPGAGFSANRSAKGTEMSDPKDKETPAAAINAEQLAQAQATARAEGHAEGLAAGMTAGRLEGATAERTRISAILSSEEATGRETLARHLAFKHGDEPDAVIALLKEAPKAAVGNALAAAMGNLGNPKVGADSGTEKGTGNVVRIDSTEIYARLNAPKSAA